MNKLDLSDTSARVIPKILRTQAEQAGDTDFLVTEDQRVSFKEAEEITNRLASGLRQHGLGKGDRVAFYMENRPEVVLLALAVNKLGAIWSPINTDYKGRWLSDTLQRARLRLLITDSPNVERVLEIQDELAGTDLLVFPEPGDVIPAGAFSFSRLLESEPAELSYEDQDYGDTCAILWTSGTTGKSKGVLQSYNSWIRPIVVGASPQYDSEEGDVIYCMLPLFNSAAWITCVFRALIEGLPCVIDRRFSVSQFWKRIRIFGATQTFALGAMSVFLLNSPARPDDADTSLRVAMMVPMPPDKWSVFEQRFGVSLLRSGLGQSECMLITNQLNAVEGVPVYSLGFPGNDIEIKLLDDEGGEVAPGKPGEIAVRPLEPYILFNGYFDSPEATMEAYRGEWYLTGDLARQDVDTGAYFYVDRKKDAIRFAGRNLSTLEVESVVRQHPSVEDVAAFGIPSEEVESEYELKIDIVLTPGKAAETTYEDICQFINDNGPHYFVPRYMEFRDSLPYTPTNKIQKFQLREKGLSSNTWDLKRSKYQVQR
jgi:crotonobetaine/carnitine-CoA ligase